MYSNSLILLTFYLLLLSINYILLKTESICPSIKKVFLERKECFYRQSTSKILITECPKNTKCIINEDKSIGKCQEYKKQENLPSYPGGRCKINEDCLSQKCVQGKCKGSDLGEKCESTKDCLFGLYCSEKFCIIPKSLNTKCDYSEQCKYPLLCHQGKCRELFSLENGEEVSNENKFLCKTGHVYNNKCNELKKVSLFCDENQKCLYKDLKDNIIQVENYCQCEYSFNMNTTGKLKCLEGDIENLYFKEAKFLILKATNKNNTDFCNLEENRIGFCREIIKNNWETRIEQYYLDKYLIEEKYSSLIPEYEPNKNSILNTLFSFDYTLPRQINTQCPKFEESSEKFKENICAKLDNPYNKNGDNIKVYVGKEKCPESYKCDYDFNKVSENKKFNFMCVYKYPLKKNIKIKYPGEKCDKKDICMKGRLTDIGDCIDGKCTGHVEGQECLSHNDCVIGYFCNSEKEVCQTQKINGDKCSSDFECQNNLVCYNSKCIELFSLEEDEELPKTKSNYNKYLCKSGIIDQKSSKCIGYLTYNVPPEKINKDGLVKCNLGENCLYSTEKGKSFSLPCECGYNKEGYSYCPLSHDYNKKFWNKLLKLKKKYFRGDCHTTQRKNCIDNDIVDEIQKIQIKTEKAHLFYGSEGAIFSTINSNYLYNNIVMILLIIIQIL